MLKTATESWESFWFCPASPWGVVAARTLLASNALWLVLSRPTLPGLREWPEVFWKAIDPAALTRFAIFDVPVALEWLAYWTLWAALIGCIAGIAPRSSCIVSGLLLYHFAPFESILASPGGPFFHGLTVPITGLVILAVTPPQRMAAAWSGEWRWPLTAVKLLFAFTYLFSGVSKLRNVGIGWVTPQQFEGLVLGMVFPDVRPLWAELFAGNELLLWMGALSGMAMDLGVVAAVFSRVAARIVIPLAAAIHLLAIPTLGVVFLNIPLLFLFVDWDTIHTRWTKVRMSRTFDRRDDGSVGS